MKKLLVVFAIVLFGMSSMKAQEASGIVKVNPLGFIFGIFNATYEKPLNEASSISVGASFFNWSSVNISGLGLSSEYRFYFSNNSEAPHGMFAAPVLQFNSLTYDGAGYYDDDLNYHKGDKETVLSFGGGVKAGHQWIWDSGIALDLYFGYGYRAAKFDSYDYSGGYPMLGLAIGYAFQ